MESFAALLTGVLLAAFLGYAVASARAFARNKGRKLGGELLGTISQPWEGFRRRHLLLALTSAGMVLPAFLFVAHTSVPARSFFAFEAGFLSLWGIVVVWLASHAVEVRERGLVLPGFVPWSDVRYCKWFATRRELHLQLRDRRLSFRTGSKEIEAVMAALLARVEMRDEAGAVLNPERIASDTASPPRHRTSPFQFRLGTLLLFLVLASSAFGWLGIHLRARWEQQAILARQEATLATYAKLMPVVTRFRNSVGGLDFSQGTASPSDADLVHLKDLPDLRYLNLSNAPITDAGLAYLEPLGQLEHIWLNRTQVTDDGVRKLREALPDAKISH